MNEDICRAIKSRNLISFDYDGGRRKVEPHCYGVGKKGELLRAFQVSGHSESGEPYGWKLFSVEKISDLTIEKETFDSPRPDYKANDSAMLRIYCCV
ncbi:MAG TPA: hypothetical protein PLP49_09370 [Anaerohalosphaeraceae bacterium]|mgnify:CR=1 FL=1|nr:hypothetical protein [Anaerohalosphaeraceae bacterium]